MCTIRLKELIVAWQNSKPVSCKMYAFLQSAISFVQKRFCINQYSSFIQKFSRINYLSGARVTFVCFFFLFVCFFVCFFFFFFFFCFLLLFFVVFFSLRKHAYSNKLTNSPPKTENFQIKYSDIFHISV